jgi:hypothetical protein
LNLQRGYFGPSRAGLMMSLITEVLRSSYPLELLYVYSSWTWLYVYWLMVRICTITSTRKRSYSLPHTTSTHPLNGRVKQESRSTQSGTKRFPLSASRDNCFIYTYTHIQDASRRDPQLVRYNPHPRFRIAILASNHSKMSRTQRLL